VAPWEELLSRLKERCKACLGAKPATLVVGAVTVLVVLAGLAFRARGYLVDASAFWLDECQWAMNVLTRDVLHNKIRPPGFILVSSWLALTLGPTEAVLRALPWLASVGALFASPFLARRLYGSSAARLFFVTVVALNACVIDFAKEFKPYSVGFMLHLVLPLLTLRYVETKATRDLGATLALAALGCFFSQDLVFAYPGLFLVLGIEALRERRPHLKFIVAVAAVIIASLVAQYLLLWRHMPKGGTNYWGTKYNVFHTAANKSSYLSWLFERYREMTGFPGIRRDHMDGWRHPERELFRAVDNWLWLALHVGGLAVMAFLRRWREALLLVLPIVLICIFNGMGIWPIGAFRSDIFVIVHFSAIAAMSFDAFARDRARWFSALPALVIVVLPLLVFERVWHERKQYLAYDSEFPQILKRLSTRKPVDDHLQPLFLDRRSCDPWRFYTEFHPKTRELKPRLEARYAVECLKSDAEIKGELIASGTDERPEWIVLHTGHRFDRLVRQHQLGSLKVITRWEIGPHTVVSLEND
jgi:hypothetical protein